jgi:hypothetical protein
VLGTTGVEDGLETRKYLRGGFAGLFEKRGTAKNLLYELNSMQKLFRCLSSQWGIAHDMEDIVDQWMLLSH